MSCLLILCKNVSDYGKKIVQYVTKTIVLLYSMERQAKR